VRTVGIVSLGAMGSAVADTLSRGGVRVVATLEGRSERTGRLAASADVALLPDLGAVVREADVVLSIVPPEASTTVAHDVLGEARRHASELLLVELNAIAPSTALAIESSATESGLEIVDGSISGPPPWRPGRTRIYLSGGRAREVAELPFEGVDRVVVGDRVGAASAVKMSTASIYKGTTALLLQALRSAHTNGVLEHVLADLEAAAPDLVARVERRLAAGVTKSSRYVGEMREIAATQSAAGLTPDLFEAMAEIYAALADTTLAAMSPEELPVEPALDWVLDSLRE
jgi:3-hydroxyisobutyrate dehydrogenase-like beta-hydroxyacid dehydrogenase